MSSDCNVRLGRSLNADQINPSDIKAGIKSEEVAEFASIFEALDNGGQTKGVLEQSEVENLKSAINSAKGKNEKLSKREAKSLLKHLNIKGVDVETFFNFLKKVIGISENIESTTTNANGNITVKYKDREEVLDKNGKLVSKTVEKEENGVKIRTTTDQNGKVISGQIGDRTYTRTYDENGYKDFFDDGEQIFCDKDGNQTGGVELNGKEYKIGYKKADGSYSRIFSDTSSKTYDTKGNWIGGVGDFGGTDDEYEYTEKRQNDDFELKEYRYVNYCEAPRVREELDSLKYTVERDLSTGEYTIKYDNGDVEILDARGNCIKDRDGNTIFYEYDPKGNILTQEKKDSNSKVVSSITNTYENGKLVKSEEKDGDGNLGETIEREYENGLLKQEVRKNGENTYTKNYTYEKGVLKSMVTNDGKKFTYDSKGRIIKEEYPQTDSNSDVEYLELEYQDDTNTVILKRNGEAKTEYKYDENGNLVQRKDLPSRNDNNRTSIVNFKYDENGIFQESSSYDFEATEDNSIKYSSGKRASVIKNSDGSFTTTALYSENFSDTMKRLGITEEKLGNNYQKAVELFTDANKEASERSNGGWFKVGEMDINIPIELAEMLEFENNIADKLLDPDEQVKNWENRKNA